MWKANGKTTTLQLFLDSLSPKNMRDASSGDKLKNALFGELSLEEAMDLSRDRQILELGPKSVKINAYK
jgi:predicted membrane GTPase involved in stress response